MSAASQIAHQGVAPSKAELLERLLAAEHAGVSLDDFVDWMIAAGRPIERIADYDDWLARFETALLALPEARSASTRS